jgi:hypothetical protein
VITDRITARVAVIAFIDALRREEFSRNRHDPVEVPFWESIDVNSQEALARCMAKALKAADPANVKRMVDGAAVLGKQI